MSSFTVEVEQVNIELVILKAMNGSILDFYSPDQYPLQGSGLRRQVTYMSYQVLVIPQVWT